MSELLLERSQWDLIADAAGNIAVCTDPYAVAQAVACECKLFLGEAWYDTTQGVPYSQEVLTASPNIGLIESLMETAAKKVTGVVKARAMLYLDRTARTVTGAVLVTTDNGVDLNVALNGYGASSINDQPTVNVYKNLITESGQYLVTEDGNTLITEMSNG